MVRLEAFLAGHRLHPTEPLQESRQVQERGGESVSCRLFVELSNMVG